MFTKFGRDEVLMARHMHKDVLAISARGGSKSRQNRSRGSPLKKTCSDRKATATNRIHSKDLEAYEVALFWFHSVDNFVTLESSL